VDIARGIKRFARRLSDGPADRALQRYRGKLVAVNAREPQLRRTSETQLREEAQMLVGRARAGTSLDDLFVDVFALVREVARREVGLRPFDVQLIGGLGLHEGKLVQMQTGEGKTLAAVSPVVLHALNGQGVHVLTFNDYLARRDAQWMGPIYRFLGLTVGFIQQDMSRAERRNAYQADVTYLTAKEAGFDFLRDGLAFEVTELVQRPFHLAVVDEADSILIDEARVPLVIAGVTERHQGRQDQARSIVQQLEPGVHFAVDAYRRNVYLTEEGVNRAEELLGSGNLYAPANLQSLTELNLALYAEVLMRCDVDYILRHGRVEIVDDFTGRVVEDRHWPDGLQAAIEAKEGVRPSREGRVLGSITVQHFLRRYPHLCGMTATAEPAAAELYEFYGLELLLVPPNRPNIRTDHPDLIFTHREAKRRALLAEIEQVHRTGRPILVGTLTVEESEGLAAELRAAGIGCSVLNAKRDAEEARIVAKAGALGAVTISTNMAGRGTDIRLGGGERKAYEQVAALGGLYVIGTNRHESRRIDDQLRGRAGRQGDPGSSRFFISLEDDLLVRCGIDDLLPARWRPTLQPEPVDNPVLRREIARAQRIVEGQNFDMRHNLWRYSNFVEQQRRVIGDRRRRVLMGNGSPSVLQERVPLACTSARQILGAAVLQDLERRLTLHAIDLCWSEHLATVAEIREGVHLAQVGGLSPLEEFQKRAAESFMQTLNAIEDRVVESFAALEITSLGIDTQQMGLRGPSSTWTYLVNDDAFTDQLTAMLMSNRNIGFAANAALTGPLLMLWALSRRLGRREKRRGEVGR
jgi:preprotein translocase subunit SecA